MDFTELVNTIHWIQWKPIFIVTICLMAIQTLLFQRSGLTVTTDQSAVLSSRPETTSLRMNPTSIPLADIQHDDISLIIEGPEDHVYPPDGAPSSYLAICMAVKNQALDLQEFFIHHYHHFGIQRFYIMDDYSSPPLSAFSYPGVPRSALTFIPQDTTHRAIPGEHFEQLNIYARCMEDYGMLHTWMAFIDADEYLEETSNYTLRGMLEELEEDDEIGALAINWRMHSSAGLQKRPQSARESFVVCITDEDDEEGGASWNEHVKVIVKTTHALSPIGPHMWNLNHGNTVGEYGDIVSGPAFRYPITRDRIALHHYVTQSREEFEEKMMRGNAMDDPKGEQFWNQIEVEIPHVGCEEMVQYDP